MTRRSRWPLWIAFGVVAVIACDPEDAPPRMFYDDFEVGCDGTPCGWESFQGEPSDAQWVESIHPGEHAVRLGGLAAIRRDGDGERISFSDDLSVRMTARCDPGTSLIVDVVVNVGGAPRSARAPINPDDGWVRVSTNRLSFEDSIVGGSVQTVVIRKVGSGGSCEVGEIVVDQEFGDDVGC